jgi:prevent-host-death family protein
MTMATSTQIKAGEFKAKCLELMDRVAASGESIVITKRGKAIAVLGPVREAPKAEAGFYRGRMTIEGDIVAPLEVDWGPAEPTIAKPRRRAAR